MCRWSEKTISNTTLRKYQARAFSVALRGDSGSSSLDATPGLKRIYLRDWSRPQHAQSFRDAEKGVDHCQE